MQAPEDDYKSIPHDIEAEKAILGAILIDVEVIEEAMEKLQPSDFYELRYKSVFEAMVKLRTEGKAVDPILIHGELPNLPNFPLAPGAIKVSEIVYLTYGLPHFSSITEYVEVVKGKSISRTIIRESSNLINSVLVQDKSYEEYLTQGQAALFNLAQGHVERGLKPAIELVQRSNERIHAIAETGNPITGLPTGFTDIDTKTLGLQPTDLIIVAGRPSMGKTALALGVAQNAAIRGGAVVAVFSLEMGEQSLSERIICSEAGIDSMRYRSGFLDEDQWELVNAATAQIAQSRLFLDETPGMDLARMNMRCRRLAAQYGKLDLTMVDYMQLMTGEDNRGGSREQEVSKYSRGLKAMAKNFQCPLIALSQLSRAPEKRANPRPLLSDLRESGSIEQDADVVMFIYREAAEEEGAIASSTAEIIIAKQRNGPTGTVPLYFHSATTKFSNMVEQF